MTECSPFRYFKTSPEFIRLAVMLYVRFQLSLRNVEQPNVIVTDKLRSYDAAKESGNEGRQETGRWLNNRAENSHQPFRRSERAMLRFMCRLDYWETSPARNCV
jgi:transposase-like protein